MVRRRLAGGGGLAEQGRAWVQVPPGARSVRSQARVVSAGAWGEARSDAGFGGVPGRSCGGAKNSAAEEVSRRDSVAGPPEDCEIAPNSRELKRAAETPWNGVSDRGKPFGNSPGRDVCGLKVRRDFRYWVRNKPIWSGCSADCAEKPHGVPRKRACGGQTRSVPRYAIPSCDFAPARVVGIWSHTGWGLRRAIGSGGLRRSLRGVRAGDSQASPNELPAIETRSI